MLAYFETVRDGLVPVKVTSIQRTSTGLHIEFKVTGRTHKAYPVGHLGQSTGLHVIPRHAIRRKRYHTWILPYSWPEECAKHGFTITQG